MPAKWLSRRRNSTTTPNNKSKAHFHQTSRQQPHFDFAFGAPIPSIPQDPNNVSKTEIEDVPRPTTSSGVSISRSFKKLAIDVNLTRPKTADGHRSNLPANPSNTNLAPPSMSHEQIGVAFGSPGHAPNGFRNHLSFTTPSGRRYCEPLPATLDKPQNKSWKKIGSMFRGPADGVQTDLKLQAPLPAEIPDNSVHRRQRSPGPQTNALNVRVPTPERILHLNALVQSPPTSTDNSPIDGKPNDGLTSLLKLDVDIPNSRLERFSFLYREMPGNQPSLTLSSSRNKNVRAMVPPQAIDNTIVGVYPARESSTRKGSVVSSKSRRSMTSPTGHRPSATYSLFPPTSSPANGKKSTRPTTPADGYKSVTQVPHVSVQLRRSLTAPPALSPRLGRFPRVSKAPAALSKEDVDPVASSPEDSTVSAELDGLWGSTESVSSASSIATPDDIFFDVRSFRDSKGVQDGHFVMTQPDSVAIELVRTRSKRSLTSLTNKAETPTFVGDERGRALSIKSMTLDEAFAAVEKLTMGTPTRDSPNILPTSRFHVSTPALPNIKRLSCQPPRPRLITTVKSSRQINSANPRLEALQKDDTPVEDSPTLPQSALTMPSTYGLGLSSDLFAEHRPPVPVKDSKFIAISKYASTESIAALERSASRPLIKRPRAITSPDLRAQAAAATIPSKSTDFPARSVSLHSSQHQHQTSLARLKSSGKTFSQRTGLTAVPAIVCAVSDAEVSVARTVSLSRKQSTRVLVSAPVKIPSTKRATSNPQLTQPKHKAQRSNSCIRESAALKNGASLKSYPNFDEFQPMPEPVIVNAKGHRATKSVV